MNVRRFGRHTRTCVDAAVHGIFQDTLGAPEQTAFLQQLLAVLRQRSDLMRLPPTATGALLQATLIRNLLPYSSDVMRDPMAWQGATGHPLHVAASLTGHLFAAYPTPKFLAAAWFGNDELHRRWAVALGQGQSVRSLVLPLPLTRRMQHLFLQTPDHVPITHGLRRAEVIGLGGSAGLVEQLLATRLVEHFDDPERWRVALQWLVNCGDSVELLHVRPLIDFLHANITMLDLRGRTFASVMRLVQAWHGALGRARAHHSTWASSNLPGLVVPVAPTVERPRPAQWLMTELLDDQQLAHESAVMRHCVASYAWRCQAGRSSIWSLRHRWLDDFSTRSVLTVEVHLKSKTVVQVRGKANASPAAWSMQLVRRWARDAGLRIDASA